MKERRRLSYGLVCFLIILSLATPLWSAVVDASPPDYRSGTPEDYDTLQEWFDFYGYSLDVVNDELGIERFPPGAVRVTVLNGHHDYDNPTGWYMSEEEIYLLFPGRPAVGDTVTFAASEPFGFYIESGAGRFYTEIALNADGFDHALVYHNTKGPGYVIAFEDLWGGGDMNYTDRILEVVLVTPSWSLVIVPQEATIEAGESQGYRAIAKDNDGVGVDMTAATLFTIDADAGGAWVGDTYTSERVGHWTINGTCEGVTGSAILIVTEPPTRYSLTISCTDGGWVSKPGQGVFTYTEGTVVDLVANPLRGYYFAGWTGDVGTVVDVNASSTHITVASDCEVKASFLPQCTLTIASTGGGGVTTPGEGTFTYDPGTVVELVAEAEEGYSFVNWTGDISEIADVNVATTTITVDEDYSITAHFRVSGGCFIATAAYGRPMAGEIQVLREFRDGYLLTNRAGRAFVDFYYRTSPPISELITERPGLKPAVRVGLMPAVLVSAVVLNTTPAEKTALVGVSVLLSVTLAVWATRRRGRAVQYA